MAPSPCRPAIANMTEIAPVLDRRRSFELAGAKTVLGNIPGGAAILGRHEISALEDRHRTIDRALAPTGHTGQRRLGDTAEGNTVGRRQRAGQARDQNFRIDVVGEGHGRGSWLARPLIPRDAGRLLQDRKSTRLNSSHSQISYAVFCLKKKKHNSRESIDPHPSQLSQFAPICRDAESYSTDTLTLNHILHCAGSNHEPPAAFQDQRSIS